MNRKSLLPLAFIFSCIFAHAQQVGSSPEYIKALTTEWKGERFPNGRPKVSDAILERLKNIPIEEAWGELLNKGFHNQFEGDWTIIIPEEAMTGRVVTAQYMPLRPDFEKQLKEQGKIEGRAQKGGTNSWPIDILTEGDVYIADSYGKYGKVFIPAYLVEDLVLTSEVTALRDEFGHQRLREKKIFGRCDR